MSQIPAYARVKKFSILHKQFTADDGELTRTLKVRRKYIEEKYQMLINGMYSNFSKVTMGSSEMESIEEISLQVIQLNIKQVKR